MCGIAGFLGIDDDDLLRAMAGSLTHRGPDDAGYYAAPGIGLTARRLAIIDLNTGSQPMANETRDVWVVFNGEIYNYDSLRKDLQQRGHVLTTNSDTETILHLYEDYGLDFVHHLRGMFALALWDAKRGRLVLARDRVGEKPLYYSSENGRLVFGSEIKAILQAGLTRKTDPQAVCDYLAAGYVASPRTFYHGISKVPPGHMLVWEAGDLKMRQYWRSRCDDVSRISFARASTELVERLTETVELCLKSDVEVGAFLSGGIDSSVIVALMRERGASVQTFCVGYDDPARGFNELHHARRVARHLGTRHHELIVGARSSEELLPQILWHYDEPQGEPSSVLVYLLSEFARRRVKVALSGTGGDEIFYGYPRHSGIRLLEYYRVLPRFVRGRVVERLLAKWPESTRGKRFARRARRFIQSCELAPEEAYLNWVSLLHKDIRAALVSNAMRSAAEDPAGDAFLREYLLGPRPSGLLDRVGALDVNGYLPEYQLAHMDRMSMAHGLEVRAPLCDFELVQWVTSLPHDYRLKGFRGKHILREIATTWLPRRTVERRKVGFDSPVGEWFKCELRPFLTAFLSREHVARSGLLDGDRVQEFLAQHLSGRRDYSLQLWSILTLEGWHRMYIEDAVNNGLLYSVRDLRGGSG